ncbi:arginine-tRNA-protein transferase [Tribonema minus]|uniref:Arginine-tRNA-protein transferase n=1 Tax=Tribonema minus TaxID=303371 RepID=A0A836CDE0_9STRA|nr:arginine-tRNA-protein transferase [Tribonema minus]
MEVDERPASEHLEGDVDPGSEYDSDSSSQEDTERGQQDMQHTLSVVEPRGKYSNSCGRSNNTHSHHVHRCTQADASLYMTTANLPLLCRPCNMWDADRLLQERLKVVSELWAHGQAAALRGLSRTGGQGMAQERQFLVQADYARAAVAAAAAAASQQHVNGDATAAGAADAWYAHSASAVGTSQHHDAMSLGGLSTSEASMPPPQQQGQPRHHELRPGSGLQRGSSEGMGHSAMSSLPPLVGAGPHQLSITTVPAAFTEEVYELYRQYQVAVHGDKPNECTPKQFKRFLVDGPLVHDSQLDRHDSAVQAQGDDSDANANASAGTEYDEASVPCGSYHQLYRINGRLIAVGVVDILPRCLSSVYCFYDPAYRALSLGKLTAFKEIEWVQAASAVRPNFQYYYLGYYIHSCEKMRYKGNYNPSDLLCPERREWVPLALCKPLLDRQSYGRLSDLLPSHHHDANQRQPSQQDAKKHPAKANRKGPGGAVTRAKQVLQEPIPADAVSSVPLLIGLPMPITVDALTPLSQQQLQGLLTEYVTMVGPALAPRMLVKLQD